MQVVSGGDKACLSQENSPGHRGERRRRRKKNRGRMEGRRANPGPLMRFKTSFTFFFICISSFSRPVSLFDTFHSTRQEMKNGTVFFIVSSQIILLHQGVIIPFFSIFSRFLHTVFGRPDESTAECMDGDLDSSCCVPLAVL